MAQQLLNRSEIRAISQEMRRIGVAETMRMQRAVASQHARVKLDDLAGGAIAQARAPAAQQQGALVWLRGGANREIAVPRGCSLRAIRDLTLLAPLAAHPNPLFGAIEVVQIQADQLADAQPAAV